LTPTPPPNSTYRVQLSGDDLDLRQAASLVDYLDRLGVSHVFTSPLLTARPHSTHGYDVVDPTRVDPALGGGESLAALSAALRERSMGIVVDVVPNHMAIGRHNPWWMDLLELGDDASHRRHFDLYDDGDPLLLPLLGRPYAEALAERELELILDDDTIRVAYWDERFPLAPASVEEILSRVGRKTSIVSLTRAEKERLRRELAAISGDADRFHAILDAQHYRLAWWQLSRERLGHRRFFTITDLVGIRQEDRTVFEDTHRLLIGLVTDAVIDGLRVDHIDGLRDPAGYLRWLADETGGTYVVVEKILGAGEQLPSSWPVAGTTGYDYLDSSTKVFVDPDGYDHLSSHYRRFTGAQSDFERLVYDQQRYILHERLGAETARFAAALERLARRDRVARDALSSDLIEVAVDLVASLPVYRTYATRGEMSETDRAHVRHAMELARARDGQAPERVRRFVERLFTLDHGPDRDSAETAARNEFVERVQQFTGAVMAKGVEDTAFYQFNLLLSLNEVGGHPADMPDDAVAVFHEHNEAMLGTFPGTMTTTSTHDTKRSEDVRARVSALSQVAEAWAAKVDGWHVRNRVHRGSGSAGLVPTKNEELFIYQTLVGAWPLDGAEDFADRITAHLVKAAREAKVHTEWLEPDDSHEEALVEFTERLVADEDFVGELEVFCDPVWRAGALDSLSQVALRMASPGIPDIYQGCEMWDLSLTDPDNRRPVDWDRRRRALDELEARASEGPDLLDELTEEWADGRIKLHITRRGLLLRRRWPDLFNTGTYVPLAVDGDRADHVVAYARHLDDRWVVVAVPRLTARFQPEGLWARDGWESTSVELPGEAPAAWVEEVSGLPVSTGGRLELGSLFSATPVAILRAPAELTEP
jgi:(1->4)-alpha-D-glucan 1-alpha-D-glucosylmutase